MNTIGLDEKVSSETFTKRAKQEIPNCTYLRYKWSEIKSSLLIQELISNDFVHKELTDFMGNIEKRLSILLDFNERYQMYDYIDELKSAYQHDFTRSYPVAQSITWINDNNIDITSQGIHTNLYAMINYIKWVWYQIHDPNSDRFWQQCTNENGVFSNFLINTFQQNFNDILSALKGDRIDFYEENPDSYDYGVSDQIGIGSFYVSRLKRTVRDNPTDMEPEPWLHPGKTCVVPFRGKYGSLMREYKGDNNFYGSVQCGISGSSHYIFFMYLISISEEKSKNIPNDVRNLITTIILQLVGDGGHNIREVLFGITSTCTLLQSLIVEINNELQVLFGGGSFRDNVNQATDDKNLKIDWKGQVLHSLVDFIKIELNYECFNNTPYNSPDKQWLFYKKTLRTLLNWEPFIQEMYNFTKDINICGVNLNDIVSTYNIKDETEFFEFKAQNKLNILTSLFQNNRSDEYFNNTENLNNIQVFHAMDNDRYNLDINISFKNIVNTKIIEIINMFGKTDIINNVNYQLDEELKKCENVSRDLERPVPELAKNIPFAFISSTPKLKSTKNNKTCVIL